VLTTETATTFIRLACQIVHERRRLWPFSEKSVPLIDGWECVLNHPDEVGFRARHFGSGRGFELGEEAENRIDILTISYKCPFQEPESIVALIAQWEVAGQGLLLDRYELAMLDCARLGLHRYLGLPPQITYPEQVRLLLRQLGVSEHSERHGNYPNDTPYWQFSGDTADHMYMIGAELLFRRDDPTLPVNPVLGIRFAPFANAVKPLPPAALKLWNWLQERIAPPPVPEVTSNFSLFDGLVPAEAVQSRLKNPYSLLAELIRRLDGDQAQEEA
jgi:hypothetical protein